MSFRTTALVLATLAALAAPGAASAYSGLGCTDLPEYDRAVGALQGMPGACDMSVEQAKRIVAEHDGANVALPRAIGPHAVHPVRPAQP